MGGNPTKPERRDSQSSSSSQYLSYVAIFSKLEQKESIFKTIEAEIDVTNDRKYLKSLACELAAHIIDLNQLKRIKLDRDDEIRRLVVTEKYELALGKLKSILSVPEMTDLVTDNNDVEPDLPIAPKNLEDEELCWVKNQYDALWDQIESTQMSLNDYCQIDRDLFCLQVRLRDFRITSESSLFDINNKVNNLRGVVNKRIEDLELFDHFSQRIKTLELRVAIEDGNKEELTQLGDAACSLQNEIQETTWEDRLMGKKADLLSSLNNVMATLNIPVTNVYHNLLKHVNEADDSSDSGSIFEDCKEEDIYGNMDVIRQYCPEKVHEYLDLVALPPRLPARKNVMLEANPRGTIYVNNDMLKISDHVPSLTRVSSELKPPKPLPRRSPGEGDLGSNEEKMIQDLPKYWNRLDEILHKEFATEEDRLEVLLIRKKALEAKVLFEKRLADIAEKFQDSVDI